MRRWVVIGLVLGVLGGCDGGGGASEDVGTAPDVVLGEDAPVAPEDAPAAPEDAPAAAEDVPAVGEDAPVAGEDVAPDVSIPFPARELPFAFSRPAEGEPIPAADVTAFTKRVTGLWKSVGWARWLLRTSTGVDSTTGTDDYLAWHNDLSAVKAGGTVTFQHRGGEHNMWIPSSKVLAQVLNGYLLTGDWELGKLTEQYCKGLTAVVKGFVWDENDPAPYLMARAIFPMDHEFSLDAERWKDDGRTKRVEFSAMYHEEDGWNAHTFAWPHNPTWGSIWVTNMRSKDDVCAIVRTTAFLPYAVADAPDEFVRAACTETMDAMRGFNQDIVDSGYNIRTKGKDGVAYIDEEQDLGSYVWYSGIDPRNECAARLASDFIAYGEPRDPLWPECGDGTGSMYDTFASQGHYYNYPIIWNYHMAALGNALVYGHPEVARPMLEGLARRMDSYMHPTPQEPGPKDSDWNRDMAVLLVQAATFGLPLTAYEARHVQTHWTKAVEEFGSWPNWDLWATSIPDGEYGGGDIRPRCSGEGIPVEALAMFLEYCNSPFRNPAGAAFVDCDVVRDMAAWGAD